MVAGVNLFFLLYILIFMCLLVAFTKVDRSYLMLFLFIELLLLCLNLNFIMASYYIDDLLGCLISLYILVVSAAEAAIGFALLVNYYKLKGIIGVDFVSSLKG